MSPRDLANTLGLYLHAVHMIMCFQSLVGDGHCSVGLPSVIIVALSVHVQLPVIGSSLYLGRKQLDNLVTSLCV